MIVHSVQRSVGIIPPLPNTLASQAAAFAVIFGYILPGMMMTIAPKPRNIALWVGYPVTIALAQVVYYASTIFGIAVIFLPSPLRQLSSYETIQLTYIILGVFSAITHMPLLFGIIFTSNPLAAAWSELVPHMGIYSYKTREEFWRDGLQNEVKRFLQWDHIMISLATWLAGSWSWAFTNSVLASRVLIVSLVGSMLFGPGAMVAATFIVKEALCQHSREKLAVEAAHFLPTAVQTIVGAVRRVLTGELLV